MKKDEFIAKYKELENLLKVYYHKESENNPTEVLNSFKEEFLKNKTEASLFEIARNIRNYYSHNNINSDEILDKCTELLEKYINEIKKPQTIYSIAIKNVFKVRINNSVKETMMTMKEKNYSHVPIVDDDEKIRGVFSENTLFNLLSNNEIYEIDSNTTFEDKVLLESCMIENHYNEEYKFVAKNTLVTEVIEIFNNCMCGDLKKRLSMVLITEHGQRNEKLLGIITPWDLLGRENVKWRNCLS